MNAMDYVSAIVAAYIACGVLRFGLDSSERVVDQPQAIREGKIFTCILLWPLLNIQGPPTPAIIITRATSATFQAPWPKTLFVLLLTALPMFIPFFCIYLWLRHIDVNIFLFWGLGPGIMLLSMIPFVNLLVFFLFMILGLVINIVWLLWLPVTMIFLPRK